jgi:hypothetical protein
MTKKRDFHPGKVWWEALCDFRNELHAHVENAEYDQLRFQTERLYVSLIKRIDAELTGQDDHDKWAAYVCWYRFVTGLCEKAGYKEAFRLHGKEITARKLFSPRSFCADLFSHPPDELKFRVRSIASWMEAQESFSLWLLVKNLRLVWKGNMDERARAIRACWLSKLPEWRPEDFLKKTKRIGINYEGKPWNATQWRTILKDARRLTEKKYDCTELEQWVWWCYPVFKRYGWTTRQVIDVAILSGIDFEKEKAGIDNPTTFQKYWIRRGLRFAWGKPKQDQPPPPLAKFVTDIVLPEREKMWGQAGGFLFPPK